MSQMRLQNQLGTTGSCAAGVVAYQMDRTVQQEIRQVSGLTDLLNVHIVSRLSS
jgi:hypothetical protein